MFHSEYVQTHWRHSNTFTMFKCVYNAQTHLRCYNAFTMPRKCRKAFAMSKGVCHVQMPGSNAISTQNTINACLKAQQRCRGKCRTWHLYRFSGRWQVLLRPRGFAQHQAYICSCTNMIKLTYVQSLHVFTHPFILDNCMAVRKINEKFAYLTKMVEKNIWKRMLAWQSEGHWLFAW